LAENLGTSTVDLFIIPSLSVKASNIDLCTNC